MNKPTSPMAQFLYAVNDAALNVVNWYSTKYHMAGNNKPEFISELRNSLNKAIKNGNDKEFNTHYRNLLELLNYTSRWGEKNSTQRLLKIKENAEEKRKDIVDSRISLMNFNQIVEIIKICSNSDIGTSISGANSEKKYHVTMEKADNGISISITCDDERGLRISYATSCDGSERFYAAGLQFHYYHYSYEKSITFDSRISVLSLDDFQNDITNILSELITPYDANKKRISWDEVPKCKYFMFSQSELQFIINMLNDTIGTKDSSEEVTTQNKI